MQEYGEQQKFEWLKHAVLPDFIYANQEFMEFILSHRARIKQFSVTEQCQLLDSIYRNNGFCSILNKQDPTSLQSLRLYQHDGISEIITLVHILPPDPKLPIRPICLEAVESFKEVIDEEGHSRGVLVSTSEFDQSARAFAERFRRRITLVDACELTDICGTELGKIVESSTNVGSQAYAMSNNENSLTGRVFVGEDELGLVGFCMVVKDSSDRVFIRNIQHVNEGYEASDGGSIDPGFYFPVYQNENPVFTGKFHVAKKERMEHPWAFFSQSKGFVRWDKKPYRSNYVGNW